MFFYIGDDCPIKSLTQVETNLFLDDGWNSKDDIWYKGYSTECTISDNLISIVDGWQPAGKWCVIYKGYVYHPVLRGFPIYTDGKTKTNLKLDGFTIVTYPSLPSPSYDDTLSLEQVSVLIGDILVENTRNLFKYNAIDNMTAIFSAGLDTLTAWVIIDQVISDYTVSLYLPKLEDKTVMEFTGTRRNYTSDLMDKVSEDYWGYHHACFYTEPNWNITGYYAETYTYRDGEAINAIANYHGKRIDELANETDYLYWFLKRPNIVEKYKDSHMEFNNEDALKQFLWSTIWYDHQMWHLDNNLMFSPFADIRIPSIVHCMSIEDIALNSVTGQIQRNIVERFRPDLLPLLSDYKNEKTIWANFRKNFDQDKMIGSNTKLIYR